MVTLRDNHQPPGRCNLVTPPSAVGARARPSWRTAAQLLRQKVFRRDLQRLGAQIMASIATCDASENSRDFLREIQWITGG